MNKAGRGFRISKIDIVDALRAFSILLTILMAVAFFAGCANRPEADSHSIIRNHEGDTEIHGDVSAAYGRSL